MLRAYSSSSIESNSLTDYTSSDDSQRTVRVKDKKTRRVAQDAFKNVGDSNRCITKNSRKHKVRTVTRVSGKWTEEEDQQLIKAVEEYGSKRWRKIAEVLNLNRSGKQCRERFLNYLDPDLNKEPWTIEEERQIVILQAQLGNQWAKISKKMGRTAQDIKNRWYGSLQKRAERGEFESPSLTDESSTEELSATNLILEEQVDDQFEDFEVGDLFNQNTSRETISCKEEGMDYFLYSSSCPTFLPQIPRQETEIETEMDGINTDRFSLSTYEFEQIMLQTFLQDKRVKYHLEPTALL